MSGPAAHDIPVDSGRYRHTGTDDEVKYLFRDDTAYHFSINGGERRMELPVEDWGTYREFLQYEGVA